MCGIVAHVGSRDCVPILLEGLAQLEYRGYDSAGLAVVNRSGGLRVHKARARVAGLGSSLPARFKGGPGIGHTRWATHGEPNDINAHPHVVGPVAVVHNGIIENADELRAKLVAEGAEFASETDSEVLAHLIARAGGCLPGSGDDPPGSGDDPLGSGDDPLGSGGRRPGSGVGMEEAVRQALTSVVGTYGIAVLDARHPDRTSPRWSATPGRWSTWTTARWPPSARTGSAPRRWTRG